MRSGTDRDISGCSRPGESDGVLSIGTSCSAFYHPSSYGRPPLMEQPYIHGTKHTHIRFDGTPPSSNSTFSFAMSILNLERLRSPSTLGSVTSFESGSTIPGPGALSGKAILALGKGTLRVAEHILIRRRLSVISSKFPHKNDTRLEGINQMYDDLLELSRYGGIKSPFWKANFCYRLDLYTESIRGQAVILLIVQIGSRQTRHLVDRLAQWPAVEINIFLSVLTSVLDPFRYVP